MSSSSGNRKNRSSSANIGKISVRPASPPKPKKTNQLQQQLSRTTKVTRPASGAGDEATEFEVSYDELKHGDLLGRGQFGTVRKMYHEPSGMTFAVKMINDDILEASDRRNADLEVPLKMGDGCPYLIKFYGALHAEAYIWIMTELMDTSLDRFYMKTFAMELSMPEAFVSKVAYAVLNALEFMRAQKLMHRDIKPSNVLLNATGEIKVCDFGISGFTSNSVCTTITGCQIYMPPEKILPKEGQGYKISADIWSLGISLFEIATGAHPFKDTLGLLGLVQKITKEPSPKLDADKFSSDFCQFIDKCLLKDADERASCVDLLKEPFITKHEKEPIDLEFVKKVIEQIKKDPIEN